MGRIRRTIIMRNPRGFVLKKFALIIATWAVVSVLVPTGASAVARGLHRVTNTAYLRVFSSLTCSVLHRIALPVYQMRCIVAPRSYSLVTSTRRTPSISPGTAASNQRSTATRTGYLGAVSLRMLLRRRLAGDC